MRGFGNYDTRGASVSSQVIAALGRYNFSGWNRALVGSFKKGANAYALGLGLDSCPYDDKRKTNGKLTWSRAYIVAWRDGWKYARKVLTGIEE